MQDMNTPLHLKQLHRINGFTGDIYRIEWSPDGEYLAIASEDQKIHIWSEGQIVKILEGHTDAVFNLSWSPKGDRLASIARDRTARIWHIQDLHAAETISLDRATGYSIAWSPDEQHIAMASFDNKIKIWDTVTGEFVQTLNGHTKTVYVLKWSQDGRWLISGAADRQIKLWDVGKGQAITTFKGHQSSIYALEWSQDQSSIFSAGADGTIRIWDFITGQQKLLVDGHSRYITSLTLAPHKNLLASKSGDNTVKIWDVHTWQALYTLTEPRSPKGPFLASIAFHPSQFQLVTLGEEDRAVRLWEVKLVNLPPTPSSNKSIHYTNAKVIVVGDTGVGKSGLSVVLAKQPYSSTESTHNRTVYLLAEERESINDDVEENRETYLWDLAGQPGYRLIHQLHIEDISAAIVVFDSRDEVNPFRGVLHWLRLLSQLKGQSLLQHKKKISIFLVAARVDRGQVSVSKNRVQELIDTYGVDGYFQTSAREGWQIDELRQAVCKSIQWDAVPKISSSQLFGKAKDFLVNEKTKGHVLAALHDLYYSFLHVTKDTEHSVENRQQFETCVNLLASRGLVHKFSFGNLLLLQPELLDSYASAIINAAKSEPDGLGYILESDALAARFPLPFDERIAEPSQEMLLLVATVEMLLARELALRVQVGDVAYLVFPSQLTRELPDSPKPAGSAVVFHVEGAILNIYATLIVRLAQSGFFQITDMWKNAIKFQGRVGGECNIYLNEMGEGQAEIVVFYGENVGEYVRFQFEEYIHAHLRRRATSHKIKKESLLICPECGYAFPSTVINLRRDRGFESIDCPVCSKHIDLPKEKARSVLATTELVANMDKIVDQQRDFAAAHSTMKGKTIVREFDVFICHNHQDKASVRKISTELQKHGLMPWLDETQLRPGLPWQKLLEDQLQQVKAAAIFVGSSGIGPWQNMEQAAFLREFIKRGCPVIPVILSDCENPPQLPVFLSGMTWVDFRKSEPDPMQQLIWGITGEKQNVVS